MLKLSRLELSGFKSFVDAVTLDVHGGMTAIVGPNGCGKSNIADAVVWALGERSAKSLRGERMEDVIFAGAQGRKPLGMAEVTLELATDNGFGAADDGRLTIGRRVFRSGESQYFLNGKTVRLKDIKDLLMDTGLGIRDYSMIEQGKIGMILSGKPQERRRLLEEAAGITRYRQRRRVAEIKLEEARANLERLADVISEVEREVRSLKRQANAARRYGTRQEGYRELLRRVLESRWGALQERLAGFQERIGELVAREAETTAELHRGEADQAEAREELERRSQQLADHHARVAELAATIEGKQEFLKGSRQRQDEIAERLAAGRAAADQQRERIVALEALLEEHGRRRAELAAERERAVSEVSEDELRISEVEALVAGTQQELEGLRGRLLGSISQQTALRNRLHREQVEREKGELRRRHVTEELERKRGELEQALAHRQETGTRRERLQEAVRELEEGIRQHVDAAEALRREREGRQETAGQLESRLEALRHRQRVLAELEEKQEERRAEIRRALEEAGLERRGFLADRFEVPDGWAASLDLFLGELADAVLLEPGDDALELASRLVRGRATGRLLLPHGTAHFVHLRIDDPAVVASLGEALGLPAEIAAVLPPAYLVESPAEAQRLARSNPGVAFISRDRLWAQAGAIHFHGEQAKPGHLERARELLDLGTRLPPLADELAALAGLIEQASVDIQDREAQRDRLDRRLAEQREQLAVAQVRHEDAESRCQRLTAETETLQQESTEIGGEIARLSALESRVGGELTELERAHQLLEQAFDSAQQAVEQARERRETTRTSGASRRGRLDLLGERLEAQGQEIRRVQGEIDEHRRQLESWGSESERLERRHGAIEESKEQAESELQQALERRERSQRDVVEQQEALDAQRARLRTLDEEIEAVRARRDELRSQIGELRVEEAGVRQDAEHLAAEFQERFERRPPEEPAEAAEDLDELEAELERRKQLLDRMGPVNLLAADEYAKQAERLEFLSSQRADVESSVARLRQTIREINQTSSQRFRATFEEVNRHFGDTFADLFRGGEAEMRLLDEDDLLETPIEIVARPPGKRLQNIMLLSGGEKALAAIALLFALFKTKPSPFCILDEVDAPLDDVNTLRFIELLRKMSEDTQFVVITHNKLTMEAANLLYGVTMQEKGVSNLVAVELDDVQPGAAAAPGAAAPATA